MSLYGNHSTQDVPSYTKKKLTAPCTCTVCKIPSKGWLVSFSPVVKLAVKSWAGQDSLLGKYLYSMQRCGNEWKKVLLQTSRFHDHTVHQKAPIEFKRPYICLIGTLSSFICSRFFFGGRFQVFRCCVQYAVFSVHTV